MSRSPNLNIIIKSLDKISNKIARDFGEIENLQNNNFAALKFANSCYKSVKEKITRDLTTINPQYNIKFLDGEEVTNDKNSRFCYIVSPIDGLLNLARSIPSFTSIIALEETIDGKKEIICCAINDIVHGEIYSAAKGGGAFLNNRKIRISSNKPLNNVLCSITNKNLLSSKLLDNKNFTLQLRNCSSLDVAHYVAGKIDLIAFNKDDNKILNITSILIKESGGFIEEKEDLTIVSNNKILK
jgi:myo-inositol-1(or 4)-monophosphatase